MCPSGVPFLTIFVLSLCPILLSGQQGPPKFDIFSLVIQYLVLCMFDSDVSMPQHMTVGSVLDGMFPLYLQYLIVC